MPSRLHAALALFVAAIAGARPVAASQEPPVPADGGGRLQGDLITDYHYSRFNFTDLKEPYDGVDGFTVLRGTGWLDARRRVGVFGDVIPVVTSVSEFFFQRYAQANIGLQIYVVPSSIGVAPEHDSKVKRLFRPLRLFAQLSWRGYYDRPSDVDLESRDTQVGLDYYYDNLFATARVKTFVFTAMGYHTTNFSFDGYDAVIWTGNVKAGPAVDIGMKTRLVPYVVTDWTSSASHRERFFENFLHAGGGVRWYPASGSSGGFGASLLRRLHLYAEGLRNVAWLGDRPPAVVKPHDIRAGIAFASGGIYRDRR